jgi:hypothetical protein
MGIHNNANDQAIEVLCHMNHKPIAMDHCLLPLHRHHDHGSQPWLWNHSLLLLLVLEVLMWMDATRAHDH